jgi:predicted transcriptional regulator
MKLNLPQSKIEEILERLDKENKAYCKVEGRDYYFTYRTVSKRDTVFDQFILEAQKVESELMEELKEFARELNKTFVVACRDKDLVSSIKSGRILYMYFFANSKYYTTLDDDIIKEEDQHEVIRNVGVVIDEE